MEPIITVNQYPIGWEWLDRVPLEDFTWLIEIFSTMTDNTDTYDFATFDKEATNGEPPYPVIEMNIIYHIIRIILSVGTILILIHNEEIYQAHKHTHPTNKIRYIISQLIILTLYTSSLILVSHTYRIILRYI